MTSPMAKVLHLDHTTVPGGAEFALRRMLLASPGDLGWSPHLMIPRGETGVYTALRGTVPISRVGVAQPAGASSGRVCAMPPTAARLLAQAAAVRTHAAFRTADVVDANTARSAAYGALAARSSRVRFVVHLRDIVDAEALGSLGHGMMTRLILPRADGVIANSRATLDSAAPFLRHDARRTVIPSASGLQPRSPSPRHDGPLRIGMAARIDPWKGQSEVLEAFARAFPQGSEQLVLAGTPLFGHEGFLEALRASAARLGIADRVVFPGHIDDVASLLEGWDIAVQYSTRPEPLGQNVLQYLASSTATVVADEGGPAEWVVDGVNGLRVAPRDPETLAAALRQVAGDAALRDRLAGEAGRTPGLLTDAQVAEAHAEFYAAILEGRAG